MTSNIPYHEAFVWIWLPGECEPVVAGKLEREGDLLSFNYGKSYLQRINETPGAIPIFEPELPLKAGVLPNLNGLKMPSCIRDSAPDAWGRRVIINRKLGLRGANTDTAVLDELTYLLESGSDRIGALDFQQSPKEYIPRSLNNASLDELVKAAEHVEKGIPLSPELDQAIFHGSSIGGARPKALIEEHGTKYVAKFSASNDLYSVVKAEYIAMRLAALAGINTAKVKMVQAADKDVVLVERFDRQLAHNRKGESAWTRKSMVSALTLLGLDDMMARYASYETLAEIIRHRFSQPKEALKELFSRLVFNVLCGNTDDHARNHAAFWNGESLSLTPAYDICPQGRAGHEAGQAMRISGENNLSQVGVCLSACQQFLLSKYEARQIIERQISIIESNWHSICDEAELSEIDRRLFWQRQFLNPFSLQGF